MKIRFLKDTFIRVVPGTRDNKPVGTMHKGAEIEVTPDIIKGESLNNNDLWYLDRNGWYYWSGGVEIVQPLSTPPPLQRPPKRVESVGAPVPPPVSPVQPPASIEPERPASPPVEVVMVPAQPEADNSVPWVDSFAHIFPPVISGAGTAGAGEIPEGETRAVPDLETLMALEKQIQPDIVPVVSEVLASRSIGGPDLEPAPDDTTDIPDEETQSEEGADSPPREEAREVFAEKATPAWTSPDSTKLNWWLQSQHISEEWWQKRGLTGKGVRIAVLSTGAATNHPDLQNKVAELCYPTEHLPASDEHGLGTQAAVIAAGTGQTAFGIAPEAELLIGRIGPQDHLVSPDGLIAGMRWAIAQGADIIAILAAFPRMEPHLLEALQMQINEAVKRGILLIAPVGSADNRTPESYYPAALSGVLSVGAHDQNGQRSKFSARSHNLDFLAPGEGLLCSGPDEQPVTNLESTAIAAALTAGFLALLRQWQHQQQIKPATDEIFNWLIKNTISKSTRDKGYSVEYGKGILNPAALLTRLKS